MEREKRLKIGEMLLQAGLINEKQIQEALRVQGQTKGRLASILIELGYIDNAKILELLGKQFGVKTADLDTAAIDPSLLKNIPINKLRGYKVFPISASGKSMTLAMVNPKDVVAINDLEFLMGFSIQPVLVLQSQMDKTIRMIESGHGTPGGSSQQAQASLQQKAVECERAVDLKHLLKIMVKEKASDLLLSAGSPPCIKKDNQLKRLSKFRLTPEQTRQFADEMITEKQKRDFDLNNELDFALTFPDICRFRINIYMQRKSVSIAMRNIVEDPPSVESLGIGSWIEEFALKQQGLILITGPVGHGKTTTMAALIDIINSKRKCNIITIEDPIEYLHKHKSSNVNQREVGVDTDSFQAGLKHIFREAPDVIVIGEIRDPESCAIALQAAETGHLVMSTIHSSTATTTIERIIDIFPQHQQAQIRLQLADNFLLILNQRLVPPKIGEGRVLAYEKLNNSHRIRNLMRENKTHQIRSLIMQQTADDFVSIDHSLARLCIAGKISRETGQHYCDNLPFFNDLVSKKAV
ncbi:MAG TPA: PilT/PilU family type 4a pilus ATPase [Dissulfurispiraceae bacterium]|nr:PilT/PilU family type 4a pilus ATPase [Dissulfurispiraceae bacterium]